MHTAERHRTKRPCQPAITSYFARDDHGLFGSHDDDNHLRGANPVTRPQLQHQAHETLAPPVPDHIQTDLMHVGMRVRKSVPEGYKTHSSKMMALPSIQTTLSHPHHNNNNTSSITTTTTTTTTITLDVKSSRGPPPDQVLHQRELLPFCGLQKLGGFAEQPTTNIHLYAGVDSAGTRPANHFPLAAETFSQPFHFSSQDSGYGSVAANPNPSKRSWHDEDDVVINGRSAFVFSKGPVVEVEEVPVSPLSATPENMLPPVRQVKMPKSRRQRVVASEDVDMDGDTAIHVDRRITVGSGSDFEEADFLGEGEVSMSGV